MYGVVHGVAGYYSCNAKVNGGSWFGRRDRLYEQKQVFVIQLGSLQC